MVLPMPTMTTPSTSPLETAKPGSSPTKQPIAPKKDESKKKVEYASDSSDEVLAVWSPKKTPTPIAPATLPAPKAIVLEEKQALSNTQGQNATQERGRQCQHQVSAGPAIPRDTPATLPAPKAIFVEEKQGLSNTLGQNATQERGRQCQHKVSSSPAIPRDTHPSTAGRHSVKGVSEAQSNRAPVHPPSFPPPQAPNNPFFAATSAYQNLHLQPQMYWRQLYQDTASYNQTPGPHQTPFFPPPPPTVPSQPLSGTIQQQNVGPYSRSLKHFESRTSSTPVRFPPAKQSKSSSQRIPDDSEEPYPAISKPPSTIKTGGLFAKEVVSHENESRKSSTVSDKQKVTVEIEQDENLSKRTTKRSTAGKRKLRSIDDESEEYISSPDVKPSPQKYVKPSPQKYFVTYVAEWKVPVGTANSGQFIATQLKQGIDAAEVFRQTDQKKYGRGKEKRRARRSKKSSKWEDDDTIPFVTNVEFDSRFLQYDRSPLGDLDQLVRPTIVVDAEEDPSESFIHKVPEEPFVSSSASRLGPRYQARVPSSRECGDKGGDAYLPE